MDELSQSFSDGEAVAAVESRQGQRLDAYEHNFDQIDCTWLRPLGVDKESDLAAVLSSPRGYRTLMLSFIDHYRLLASPADGFTQNYSWVFRGRAFLRELALQLGLLANAEFLRTSVTHEAVAALHGALGKATCRDMVDACTAARSIRVSGLTRTPFDAALHSGNIQSYLLVVGSRLLELALLDADSFVRQRLRFAFADEEHELNICKSSVDLEMLTGTVSRLAREL